MCACRFSSQSSGSQANAFAGSAKWEGRRGALWSSVEHRELLATSGSCLQSRGFGCDRPPHPGESCRASLDEASHCTAGTTDSRFAHAHVILARNVWHSSWPPSLCKLGFACQASLRALRAPRSALCSESASRARVHGLVTVRPPVAFLLSRSFLSAKRGICMDL